MLRQKELDDYVAIRLRSVGFDLTKEIRCHAMYEREGAALTQVFTQEKDAPKVQTETLAPPPKRPKWLKELRND